MGSQLDRSVLRLAPCIFSLLANRDSDPGAVADKNFFSWVSNFPHLCLFSLAAAGPVATAQAKASVLGAARIDFTGIWLASGTCRRNRCCAAILLCSDDCGYGLGRLRNHWDAGHADATRFCALCSAVWRSVCPQTARLLRMVRCENAGFPWRTGAPRGALHHCSLGKMGSCRSVQWYTVRYGLIGCGISVRGTGV